MKVVLIQDIDAGDKWDVINVSDGYARNYLIPLNKAIVANAKNLKTVEDIKKQQAKKIAKQKQEVEDLKNKISKLDTITISVKAGEKGKLFGAVTPNDIVEKIKEVSGLSLDKKRLQTRSIKDAGKYVVNVKLPFNMQASVTLIVEADFSEKVEEIVDMREVLHKKRRKTTTRSKKDEKNITEDSESKEEQSAE